MLGIFSPLGFYVINNNFVFTINNSDTNKPLCIREPKIFQFIEIGVQNYLFYNTLLLFKICWC